MLMSFSDWVNVGPTEFTFIVLIQKPMSYLSNYKKYLFVIIIWK